MKYILTIFTIISAFVTFCIFILFIQVFIAWLNGGGSVLLPGLGLIIAAPLLLVILFIIGIIMFSLTVLLIRMIVRRLP